MPVSISPATRGPRTPRATRPARTHRLLTVHVAGLVGLVMAGSALLVAPAATAATPVSLSLTPTALADAQHVVATGRAVTAARRPVQLQVQTASGWQTAARSRTFSRGRYQLTDPVSRSSSYRVVLPRVRRHHHTLRTLVSPAQAAQVAPALDVLASGAALTAGQTLTSADGTYVLTMQPGGNLVLTTAADPATVVWSTDTDNHPGARLVMQTRGNLVVVDAANVLLWDTGSTGTGAFAKLPDSGDLSVIAGTTTLWDRDPGVEVPTAPVSTTSDATTRGQTWVQAGVKYSQSKYFTNIYGTYRTDCSGYVSMMWGRTSSYTTRSIPSISHVITKDELQSGDVLNSPGYHVVLFDAWANAAHTQYWGYEETPNPGAVHHVLPYPYWGSSRPNSFVPRREN